MVTSIDGRQPSLAACRCTSMNVFVLCYFYSANKVSSKSYGCQDIDRQRFVVIQQHLLENGSVNQNQNSGPSVQNSSMVYLFYYFLLRPIG